MDIIITNTGNQPIYEQISAQIKAKIISGELNSGDALPSMRLLAKELRISVITTKRAYEELERCGFIFSVTGKGSFVGQKNVELIREENLRKIEEYMDKVTQAAQQSGIELPQLTEMLELIYNGRQ